jgi:signal transduction histidine kinase
LVETLQHYISNVATPTCAISFETHGEPWKTDDYSELTVYRIVQELINNILKHSAATEGFVSLSFLPHELQLVVEDNGKGFDTNQVSSMGHGLSNLKARLTFLNANFDLVSKPGKGTSFTIIIPKADVKN